MNQEPSCKICGSALIEKATKKKPSQLTQPYYYTAYYWCPKCQKLYHDEKFKVVNERAPQVAQVSMALQAKPHPDPLLKGEGTSFVSSSLRGEDKGEGGAIEIWTDGACVFNGQANARAAWAFVAGDVEQAGLVPGVKQTNNVAEALAIYHALLWAAEQGYKRVAIHTDSQISLHNVLKQPSLVKLNQEIFQMIADVTLANDLRVSYKKVLGHSGDVNNERADKLATTLAGH